MSTKAKRESGYYRVYIFNRWEPVQWDGKVWRAIGSEAEFDDDFWTKIDENRLEGMGP